MSVFACLCMLSLSSDKAHTSVGEVLIMAQAKWYKRFCIILLDIAVSIEKELVGDKSIHRASTHELFIYFG